MKQKWIILLLTMTMLLSACGGKQTPAGSSGDSVLPTEEVTLPAPEETPEDGQQDGEETEQPEEPAQPDEPAKSVEAEQPEKVEQPAQPTQPVKPAQPAKTEKPAQPAKPAESKPAEEKSVDLSAFYTSITETYADDLPSLGPVDGEALEQFYSGLGALNCKQTVVYMAMISAVPAEFALVEASTEEEAQQVKTIFQTRMDDQVNGGAWYPETIERWQDETRIVSNGRYVMLVCFDHCDDVVQSFNALF